MIHFLIGLIVFLKKYIHKKMNSFVPYDLKDDYFAYNIQSMDWKPRQKLDQNVIFDDNTVIFPRNIYGGEPIHPPVFMRDRRDKDFYVKLSESKRYPPLNDKKVIKTEEFENYDESVDYSVDARYKHPLYHSWFKKPVTWGGLCRFGYTAGNQSGTSYNCGGFNPKPLNW